MIAQAKKRYYVHGDRSEEDPDSYYCAACDLFRPEAHFHGECHCTDHYARYTHSHKGLKTLLKNSREFMRPAAPFNLFA